MRRVMLGLAALLAALLAVGATHTLAQSSALTDSEPNNTCATAQDLGAIGGPIALSGAIEAGFRPPYPEPGSVPPPDTVDFFALTAPAGATLLVELRGSSSFQGSLDSPMLGIFDGCTLLAAYDNLAGGSDPVAFVQVPASGSLVIAATAYNNAAFGSDGFTGGFNGGSYTLRVEETQKIAGISGSLVDATSGDPVFDSAFVELQSCAAGACASVTTLSTYSGSFSFSSSVIPLLAGSYQLVVTSERYETLTFGPFDVAVGESKDVGAIGLTPRPTASSIGGRIVNAVNGAPLRAPASATVELLRCQFGACWAFVGSAATDAAGNFRFDAGNTFSTLFAGEYIINFYADQYQFGSYGPFTAGANEAVDLGAVRIQPNRVQFFDARGCAPIPAQGGDCDYSIRVANGRSEPVQLRAWGTITASGATSSVFQPESVQSIRLAPGESRTLNFKVSVPRAVPPFTFFCGQVYVSDKAQGFFFQPLAAYGIFCSTKGEDGVTRPLSEEQTATLFQRARGVLPAQRNRQ